MTKLIGDEYMKEADEKLKDAKDKKIDIPEPEVPDVETNPEINDNIVDSEDYRDYDNFMDILKDLLTRLNFFNEFNAIFIYTNHLRYICW